MPLTDGYLIAQGDTNWQFVNTGPGNLSSVPNPYTIINGIRAFLQIIEGYGNGKVDYSKPDCLVTDVPEIAFTPNKPASQLSDLAQELIIGYAGVGPQNLSTVNVVWNQPIVLLDPNKVTVNGAVADCSVLGRVMTITLPTPVAIDGSTTLPVKIEKDAVGAYVSVIDDTVYNVPTHSTVAETAIDTQDTDQDSPSKGQTIQAFISLTEDQSFEAKCTHQYSQVSITNCKGAAPECWQVAMHLWGSTIPLNLFPIDQNIDISNQLDVGYPAVAVEPIEVGVTGKVAIIGVSGDPVYIDVDNCGEALIQLGQAITVTSLCGGCVNYNNATVNFIYALPDVEEQIYKPQVRMLNIKRFSEVTIPVAGSVTPVNFASVNIPLYSNGTSYVTGVGTPVTLYLHEKTPTFVTNFIPTDIKLTMLTSTIVSTETFFYKTDTATADKIVLGVTETIKFVGDKAVTNITSGVGSFQQFSLGTPKTVVVAPAIKSVTPNPEVVSVVTSLTVTNHPNMYTMWKGIPANEVFLQSVLATDFITTQATGPIYKQQPVIAVTGQPKSIQPWKAGTPKTFATNGIKAATLSPVGVTVVTGGTSYTISTGFTVTPGSIPGAMQVDIVNCNTNSIKSAVGDVGPSIQPWKSVADLPAGDAAAITSVTAVPGPVVTQWSAGTPLSVGAAGALIGVSYGTANLVVCDGSGNTQTLTVVTSISTTVGTNVSVPVLTAGSDVTPITSLTMVPGTPVQVKQVATDGSPISAITSITTALAGTVAVPRIQVNSIPIGLTAGGSVTFTAGSGSASVLGPSSSISTTPADTDSVTPVETDGSAFNVLTSLTTTLGTETIPTVLTGLTYELSPPYPHIPIASQDIINIISTVTPNVANKTLITSITPVAADTASIDQYIDGGSKNAITSITLETASLKTSTFFSSTSQFYLGARKITEPTGYTEMNLTSLAIVDPSEPAKLAYEPVDGSDNITYYNSDSASNIGTLDVSGSSGSPVPINYSVQTGTVQAIAADAGGPIQLISNIGTGALVTVLINDPAGSIRLVEKQSNLQQWGIPGYSPAPACTPGQAGFSPPSLQNFEGDDQLYLMAPIPMVQAPSKPAGVAGPTDVPGFTVPEQASPMAVPPTDVDVSGQGYATLQVRRMAHARMFKHQKGC
jgi:hypothetical protein